MADRLDGDQVLNLLFDDDFELSDSDGSDDEDLDGSGHQGYLGEERLESSALESSFQSSSQLAVPAFESSFQSSSQSAVPAFESSFQSSSQLVEESASVSLSQDSVPVCLPSTSMEPPRSSFSGRRCRGRGRGRGRRRGTQGTPSGAVSTNRGNGSGVLDPIENLWSKREPTQTVYDYKLTPGPTSSEVSAGANLKSVDLFNRFFCEEVWDLLVDETNNYASLNMRNTPQARPWKAVTKDEMKAFIGLMIAMGILKLPRLECYWKTGSRRLRTSGISEVMPRVRFEQIFRFFHLSDSTQSNIPGTPTYSRLYKVKKLLGLLESKFDSEYEMGQQCTIDEAMIPFKGRLGFKQYMRAKPVKWGIKVWVLADSKNGYVKKLQIYTGKEEGTTSSIGLCSRVVLNLMNGLEGSGLHLYTDNFYTSPSLFHHLYNRGINSCGTVRSDRKHFPSVLVTKASTSNRGHYDYRSNSELLASVWIDKRAIYFLSTLHPAEPSDGSEPPTVKRRKLDGSQEEIACPPLLPDYQAYMRGVDRGDQLQSYYNVGKRSRKWWKRIFYYLLECSILNAYILDSFVHPAEHSNVGKSKRDLLQFRKELVDQLVGGFCSRQRTGRPSSMELERLQPSLGHYPEFSESRGRCVVCLQKNMRHETAVKCQHCDVLLCCCKARNCFTVYHTKTNF